MHPDTFKIETMTFTDLDQIYDIEVQVHEYPWGRQIFTDCLRVGYQGYIVRDTQSAAIRSFALFSSAADECHLLNVATHRDYQKQGLAKALLMECLNRYHDQNIQYCYLEVRESNANAIALYESMGFFRVGIRSQYYPCFDGREDALVMKKIL